LPAFLDLPFISAYSGELEIKMIAAVISGAPLKGSDLPGDLIALQKIL
jgi:hypothetical protein